MELLQNSSGIVKPIETETSDGLYQALATVLRGKVAVAETVTDSKWHESLGHCNNNVLHASLPHNGGIKENEIGNLHENGQSYASRK